MPKYKIIHFMLQVCSPVFLFKINVYYGREYRLLIDVGKFAVYQTDGFFFFASSLPLMLGGEDGVGHALNLLVLPGCTAAGPAGKAWVRAVAAALRNSQKEGERRGTLAESLPIEFTTLLVLFSVTFRSFCVPLD